MNLEDFQELHYITPITNISLICSKGLLSHNRVKNIEHVSVAMKEIQARRARKSVHLQAHLDCNASSDYARFYPSPSGLAYVDRELVFSESWKHPEDQIREWKHKSAKCAEVMVPDRVNTRYIMGAYVSCLEAKNIVESLAKPLDVLINSYMFFR